MNQLDRAEWILELEKKQANQKLEYELSRLKYQREENRINNISSLLALYQSVIIGLFVGGTFGGNDQ